MKKFDRSKLEQPLFLDCEKTKKALVPLPVAEDGTVVVQPRVQYTLKTQILFWLDNFGGGKTGLTRERLKSIQNIENCFNSESLIIEDKDFDFLKKFVDEIGITTRSVYAATIDFIDSAEDYKS